MKKSLLALFTVFLGGAVSGVPAVKTENNSAVKTPAPAVEKTAKAPVKSILRFRVTFSGDNFFNVGISKLASSSNAVFSQAVVKGKAVPCRAYAVNKTPLTDQWQKFTVTFTPSLTGEINMFIDGVRSAGQPGWIFVDNFEAKGTRILNPSFEQVYASTFARWYSDPGNVRRDLAGVPAGKNAAAVCAQSGIRQVISVVKNTPVSISFYARLGDDAKVEKHSLPNVKTVNDLPKNEYRFYDAKTVKYLPLKNKGVPGNTINPAYPWITPGRTPLQIIQYPVNQRNGRFNKGFIPFELLEESGISRTADVKFGFPFKRGDIFGVDKLSVLSPAGNAVPAQFTAISFWPDKSIKFVLAEFRAPLKAKERSNWKLCINSGKIPPALPVLRCMMTSDGLEIDTGKLQANVGKYSFGFLRNVRIDGKKVGSFDNKGLVVVDENKKVYTSSAEPLSKLYIESSGPLSLTLRAEGEFENQMGRFLCRMTFRAGSPVVDFSIRYMNVNLKNEFNDIRSLKLSYIPVKKVKKLRMDGVNCRKIFQHNDRKLQIDGRFFKRMMSDGGSAGNITFSFKDAGKRYPKAFDVSSGNISFELLPEQPDANFGKELPYYLNYPFCQGLYRMKWGMGFTEEFKIDFSGKTSPFVLAAKSVVPVIDTAYLHKTRVFQGIPDSRNNPFAALDAKAVEAFYRHMKLKAERREYGFLNWGDWFGERNRNWGNNEYDLSNGLFMLYLRTGNRDVFRWAMTAARHQADVDIIHAYPDPAYVGANVQHGVGHTGQSFGTAVPAVWSKAYDSSSLGWNGHTWSEGLTVARLLGGDEFAMDSALLLGEHLANYIAPQLKRLSTHERTAGWAVTALLGVYRATGNRKYLYAAGYLVNLILEEQKFHLGGAWPHKLPHDHANGHKDTCGNCPYLVGIVLHALQQYNEEAPSASVQRSVIAAANWLHRGFDRSAAGWSYGMGYDGKKFHAARQGLNLLITPGMMTGGRFANNRKIYDTTRLITSCALMSGFSSNGKELAMQLCMLPVLFEEMNRYSQRNPKAGKYKFQPSEIAGQLNNGLSDRFNLRGPDKTAFEVVAAKPAEITINRYPVGSRPKEKKDSVCRITDQSQKVIKSFKAPNTVKGDWKVKLPAKGRYMVEITDFCSGIWNVSGKDCRIRTELRKGYLFAHSGISRQLLMIPAGTKEFSLEFSGAYEGSCYLFLLDPQGRFAGSGQAVTSRLPRNKGAENLSKGKIKVKIAAPSAKETAWKLIIVSNGSVRLDLIGTKGQLALAK